MLGISTQKLTQIVSKMKLGMSDLALHSFVSLQQVAVFFHILDSDCRIVCAAKLVILSRGLSGEL